VANILQSTIKIEEPPKKEEPPKTLFYHTRLSWGDA
jgi:hypothetical protein